jgi:hypothetical protein
MAGRDTRFKPGQSGNPGGRPKEVAEVRELARRHTKKAIATLAEIMLDEKALETAGIAATNSLLDRGYGRPELQHKISGQINFAALLAEYTTQRLAVEQGEAEVLEGDDQDSLPGPNGNGADQ